ncbi:Gfo/Idh/MocA family protein [Blastopirellula marina]|uniref:Gfo/Idh/MocA family oxidoreductase n=1 Tax=Blastopirellula marina TaxID=124 RepID=A0A2S8GCP7_9BACT|nr:Gfo/Idh/MocA family oxidoreductase [Blastopirellula marina]PQO42245.1 gfo/Idh/MocA family oxidoreductase [Blastopirellula marina]
MRQVRLAVIGTGHLGKIHARLAKGISAFKLVGVVDPNQEARDAFCKENKIKGYSDIGEIASKIDAAVIATPTLFHKEVAAPLLEQGKHVLIEKPITLTTEDADELIKLAGHHRSVLQVGHVERFNPAFREASKKISTPRFIQAARTSGYTFRSIDVGVTLDLMIHDIDLVLSLVRSPVVDVKATGLTVFGPHEDVVETRLTFANGCVANLTASRASYNPARHMEVFSDTGFVGVDFTTRTVKSIVADEIVKSGVSEVHELSAEGKAYVRDHLFSSVLPCQEIEVAPGNAIEAELCEFADCIQRGLTPTVTGEAARDALAVALQVRDAVHAHRWDGGQTDLVGPSMLPQPKRVTKPKKAA